MQADNPFAAPQSLVADPSGSAGAVSPGVVETLRRTKGWVRLMAIMGFIGAGFMVLAATGMGIAWTVAPPVPNPAMLPIFIGYAVLLGGMGVLYVVPSIRLYKYARGIARLEVQRDGVALEYALDQQRGFWRFVGVTTIAVLVFYGLLVVGLLGIGIFSGLRATP